MWAKKPETTTVNVPSMGMAAVSPANCVMLVYLATQSCVNRGQRQQPFITRTKVDERVLPVLTVWGLSKKLNIQQQLTDNQVAKTKTSEFQQQLGWYSCTESRTVIDEQHSDILSRCVLKQCAESLSSCSSVVLLHIVPEEHTETAANAEPVHSHCPHLQF